MKNLALMSALGLAIIAGGAVTTAEAAGDKHRPHHSFEELDANSDGKLTRAEIETHMQMRFEGADTDADGVLSKDELLARLKKGQSERAEKYVNHMLDRHDANGDGALSLEEMKARHDGKMFGRMDADQDGAVTKQEFEEARAKFKDRKGKRHDKNNSGE